MFYSMTGFATRSFSFQSAQQEEVHVTIQIRSLNSRYFEGYCKLPSVFLPIETNVLKLLKKRLIRGNILCIILIDNQHITKTNVQVSLPVLKGYLRALADIQQLFKIPGEISISDLLTLSNSIFVLEQKEFDQTLEKRILEEIEVTLEELVVVRAQEGEELKKDIVERYHVISQRLQLIKKVAHQFTEQRKNEIMKKIQALEEETTEIAQIKRNSLILELDRCEIHEEIVRLAAHLSALKELVDAHLVEKGKKFNFILQEMSREINTLTAKSADSELLNLAIDVKVELEKIREQTQNIV